MQPRPLASLRAAARGLGWVALPLLVACGASKVQSQKLNDGSWAFTCELAMDECIRRVQQHCPAQRYRILAGTSETRLRDAPPFERAYHTSRLHLVCTDAGADVLLSFEQPSKPDGSSSASSSPPGQACTKGQTRECVGPAACKGGQACLPDGSGYGACDCGPAPGPAPAAPEPEPEPEPEPAVGPPQPG